MFKLSDDSKAKRNSLASPSPATLLPLPREHERTEGLPSAPAMQDSHVALPANGELVSGDLKLG